MLKSRPPPATMSAPRKSTKRRQVTPIDSDDDINDLDFGRASKPAAKRKAAAAKKKPATTKKPPPPKKPRKVRQKAPPKAKKVNKKATPPQMQGDDFEYLAGTQEQQAIHDRTALELTEEYSTALILQSLSQRSHASYYQKVHSQIDPPTSMEPLTLNTNDHMNSHPLQIVFHSIPYPPDQIFAIGLDHSYSAETTAPPPSTTPEVTDCIPEVAEMVELAELPESAEMVGTPEMAAILSPEVPLPVKEGSPPTEQDSGYMSGDLNGQPAPPSDRNNNNTCVTSLPVQRAVKKRWLRQVDVEQEAAPIKKRRTGRTGSPATHRPEVPPEMEDLDDVEAHREEEQPEEPEVQEMAPEMAPEVTESSQECEGFAGFEAPDEVVAQEVVQQVVEVKAEQPEEAKCLARLEQEVTEEREMAQYQINVAQFANPESQQVEQEEPPPCPPDLPLTTSELTHLLSTLSTFHTQTLAKLRELNQKHHRPFSAAPRRAPFKLDLKLDYDVDQMSVQINQEPMVAPPSVPVLDTPTFVYPPPSSLTPEVLAALQTCAPTRVPHYVAKKAARVDAHFGQFGHSLRPPLSFEYTPTRFPDLPSCFNQPLDTPLEGPANDFYEFRKRLSSLEAELPIVGGATLKNGKILTKTMGADPRLNPALICDDKETEITPKKKLSLDQYRKRKTEAIDCP